MLSVVDIVNDLLLHLRLLLHSQFPETAIPASHVQFYTIIDKKDVTKQQKMSTNVTRSE